jgi:microcystin degradation protein MlrC
MVERVVTASIRHEANTFASRNAALADFERQGLWRGAAVLTEPAGTNDELAGFVDVAERAALDLVPVVRAYAQPLGWVERDAFAALKAELLDGLRAARAAGPVDGVLLALHGAMSAVGVPDADGDLLASVRDIVGPGVPVVCTHDLHANVTAHVVASATAVVGYHTAPHVDVADTGRRAAELLVKAMRGEARPVVAWRKLPMISPAENHRSSVGRYGALFRLVDDLEARTGILSASLFTVQPWLDVPELGWTALVVADGERAVAERAADELASAAWDARHELLVDLVPVEEAVERARRAERGPIVFVDSADSTNSGATGDSSALIEALVGQDVGGPVLLFVVDPDAAHAAHAAGVGTTIEVDVGGALDPDRFRTLTVEATVERLSDGRFRIESPMLRGQPTNTGPTAALRIGDVRLVVCAAPPPGHDPGIYRHLGLEPAEAKVVQVKSPSGFRAWYEPIAADIVLLDTPGAATANLASLRFERAPRPLFPVDPDAAWRPGTTGSA